MSNTVINNFTYQGVSNISVFIFISIGDKKCLIKKVTWTQEKKKAVVHYINRADYANALIIFYNKVKICQTRIYRILRKGKAGK